MRPKPSTAAIRTFYDSIASRYDRWIAPAICPLIANLIATIPTPVTGLRALDIGSGTGIAAKMLTTQGVQAIGIDLSAEMLLAGKQPHSVQADLTQPPFAAGSFDLIVSAFGLNNTDPADSLRQIRRLLRPGGWLIGQEWAVQDPIAAAFDQAIGDLEFSADDPRADLPDRWGDQMQEAEDYRDRLAAAGFSAIRVTENSPNTIRLLLRTFVGYRLAWLTEPIGYVDPIARRLESLADQDGVIRWQPSLFRFTAQHPL